MSWNPMIKRRNLKPIETGSVDHAVWSVNWIVHARILLLGLRVQGAFFFAGVERPLFCISLLYHSLTVNRLPLYKALVKTYHVLTVID
jgi:hypothetical protein